MPAPEDKHHTLPENWLDNDLDALASLAPLQEVVWPEASARGVRISIKREDLLDAQLGGNKLYKLYYHLKHCLQRSSSPAPLVSYGGAYSNHIYALAAAGHSLGLKTVGIIRGETPDILSPTLRDAQDMGMQLHFISRGEYRLRGSKSFEQAFEARTQLGTCHWIPEGGGGILGAKGCQALVKGILSAANKNVNETVDVICHACGTGTSLAGMISAGIADVDILGVAVLNAKSGLEADVQKLLGILNPQHFVNWSINGDFHFGGYAKFPQPLIDFIRFFESRTGIPLDPVYTGKLLYAVVQLAENGFWQPGTHVVVVHSGGLQGRRGCDSLVNQR